MISLDEFRERFINDDVRAQAANEERYPEEVFIEQSIDILRNAYSSVSELDLHYWDYSQEDQKREQCRKYKVMHIDAGYLDVPSNTLNLLYADYNAGDVENITNEFWKSKSQLLVNFFENCLKGFFFDREKSDPTVQFADEVYNEKDSIYKLHLFIVSTNKLSRAVKKLKCEDIKYKDRTYRVDLDVLDIDGIYKSKQAGFKKDELVIECSDYGCKGIPCIKADIGESQYESYLAVVTGEFLANIYKEHSSELLESNVRSFLKFAGGVNKGIRATILNDRTKFFTYNNGISTTAKEITIETDKSGGMMITSLRNLQIINGGQTTATLAATSIRDKANLSGIFVQMKLTIVRDENPELIRNIATYANSQNKVSTSSLNSSHPFYVKIEEISRKRYAPKSLGDTYETLWFFERTRGQYDQPTMQMTKAEKNKYQLVRPKNQRFTLTDLAKYCNAADCLPHYVSWGGEVNAAKFHENMLKQWEKDSSVYNEYFYKELIGKKIMFSFIENVVSDQSWYQKRRAYRPQIVAYTFSKLVDAVASNKKLIDFKAIWDKQVVSEFFREDVAKIAKMANDCIYATSGNVGSYCKKEACWKSLKVKDYQLSPRLETYLISPKDREIAASQAKRADAFESAVMDEVEIFKKGITYWQSLKVRAQQQNMRPIEYVKGLEIILGYCNMDYLQLTKKQLAVAQDAIKHLKENGIE